MAAPYSQYTINNDLKIYLNDFKFSSNIFTD